MSVIKEFDIKDDDYFAIVIARNTVRRLLMQPSVNPIQVIGLGNALYALERLPLVTEGAYCEFGLVNRSGTKDFNEMSYINFRISEEDFEISRGGSTYDRCVGGNSYSKPGWLIEVGGYRETECQLFNMEDLIQEYINLGAEISVSDESDIYYE